MKTLNGIFSKLEELLVFISGLAIVFMMFWICLDVLFRTAFNSPIEGTIEIIGEYFMVIIVFFSISYIFKIDGHVSVDLFQKKFSKKMNKILRLITNMLTILVFFILGLGNFFQGIDYIKKDMRSSSMLEFPLAPAVMMIVIGIFFLIIRVVIDSINVIKNKKKYDLS